MKKIVITYGLIAGAIVGGLMLAMAPLWKNGTITFDNGELVGYTTMVIALSTIFIGIKSYRDNHAGAIITFWSGCKIGLLITLIAGILYAMAWEVSFANMGEEFTQKMTAHYLAEMQAGGASEAELQKAREEWVAFSELYKNPLVRFPITILEILPVGIIITLLSAGLLRKKEFLPSAETNHA